MQRFRKNPVIYEVVIIDRGMANGLPRIHNDDVAKAFEEIAKVLARDGKPKEG